MGREAIKNEEIRLGLLEKAKEVCGWLYTLGAKEVYVFGSVLSSEKFRYRTSDIDLAVTGMPEAYIYKVEGKIEDLLEGHAFHLIYMEEASEQMVNKIKERGEKL